MGNLSKKGREAAAKAGMAMPNGKYPIRTRGELKAAIHLRHHSTEPYPAVRGWISSSAARLGVKITPSMLASAEFAAKAKGAYGRSASLKWPWLYDKLVAKGYDHSKAAAISNSRVGVRKKGRLNVLNAVDAHNPKIQAKIAKADKAGKHVTGKQLTGRKHRSVLTASADVAEFYNMIHSRSDGRFASGGGGPKA
mgnify:CR=1 FL=1